MFPLDVTQENVSSSVEKRNKVVVKKPTKASFFQWWSCFCLVSLKGWNTNPGEPFLCAPSYQAAVTYDVFSHLICHCILTGLSRTKSRKLVLKNIGVVSFGHLFGWDGSSAEAERWWRSSVVSTVRWLTGTTDWNWRSDEMCVRALTAHLTRHPETAAVATAMLPPWLQDGCHCD